MTDASAPNPADPTLAIAEQQLAVLAELVQMSLAVSRGCAAASLAASNAVEVILADEYWVPETGRARAIAGGRDAAEAYQKASRALRLTLKLQMETGEILRDIRAGVITNSNTRRQDAGETPALRLNQIDQSSPPERRRPAGSSDIDAMDFDKPGSDRERLVEFDRPDRLPRAPFRETVDYICADLGVAPDWANWKIGRPKLAFRPLEPRPPGWSECRPPQSVPSGEPAPELAEKAEPRPARSP